MNQYRNIKITLQYDGTRYDGWQKQGNTPQTIQGKLEAVLEKMTGKEIEVHGSGRTDAGVHALSQTANFHIPEEFFRSERFNPHFKESDFQKNRICAVKWIHNYLNQYLPEDIRVLTAEEAAPRFHSRFHAVSKTYIYKIETSDKKDVFERKYRYGLGRSLDLDVMKEAASCLYGTHDFKSFCSLKKMKKSTVRTITDIRLEKRGSQIELTFTGNGFLYNMVRIMTGTLIEVGLGERTPESVREILEAKDRSQAGFTAPPEGLFLEKVEYSEKNFQTMQ